MNANDSWLHLETMLGLYIQKFIMDSQLMRERTVNAANRYNVRWDDNT